jgi:hypothetical protein
LQAQRTAALAALRVACVCLASQKFTSQPFQERSNENATGFAALVHELRDRCATLRRSKHVQHEISQEQELVGTLHDITPG